MINTATRNLYNSICSLIQESNLPPVNIELVLSLILRDVASMTNEEIKKEGEVENETRNNTD